MLSQRKRINQRPLLVSLLVALLVHLLLIFTQILPMLGALWEKYLPAPVFAVPSKVSVVTVPKALWEANRTLRAGQGTDGQKAKSDSKVAVDEKLEQKRAEEKKKREEEEKKLNGQVVEVAPSADNRKPDNARFLSERNNRVEKESLSRYRGPNYPMVQSRPTMASDFKRAGTRPQQGQGQDEVAMVMRKEGSPDAQKRQGPGSTEIPFLPRQPLKLQLDLNGGNLPAYQSDLEMRGTSDKLRIPSRAPEGGDSAQEPGENGQDQRTVAMMRRPSFDRFDVTPGGPSNDHVKDVPEGDETLLNTREFRYATFFNRVKRGVSNNWNPAGVYMRADPYGNVYGIRDRQTVLNVELGTDGAVADVNVAQSCGLDFLDLEAVQAFQKASPFPNPPTGLLETDGRIRFQFGFYFEISDRPRFQAIHPRTSME